MRLNLELDKYESSVLIDINCFLGKALEFDDTKDIFG